MSEKGAEFVFSIEVRCLGSLWYNPIMIPELTKELSDALRQSGSDRLSVVDPTDNRVYVLVDAETLESLETQQAQQSIQAGLESMEADRGISIDDADVLMRQRLGFPRRE